MSYYILPKTNNSITIKPNITNNTINPYVSQSLFFYYNETKLLLLDICLNDYDLSFNTFSEIIKIVNPYEYIFSLVPGSRFSVSKLTPNTNTFYELFEVMNTLNIFDILKNYSIKSLHISQNSSDSVECIEIFRGYIQDYNLSSSKINNELYKNISDDNFDFMFYEVENNICDNLNLYVINIVKFIMIILKNQAIDGVSIIKIDHMFHKPVLDILYVLSSLYEKVYIIKPNTSNVTTFEKYIVCKRFIYDETKSDNNRTNYYNIFNFLRHYTGNNISSLVDHELPNFFVNKINDINVIIGQQQIESHDQIINILKNKNRYDKLDVIKKINIQKSVNWCEKHKFPCNKFSDKTNIFLPFDSKDNSIT
jgi:hypothetical protein